MQIDVQLIPFLSNSKLPQDRIVVVIDVLRATSVIVQALSQGASEIIPVATVEEAFQMAKVFQRESILLGGERESKKIPGFDLGNSPKEYVEEKVKGKKIILATTNGTKAFQLVPPEKEILVGSFFNIGAVAKRCLDLEKDILVFLSGNGGSFSLEDTLCAGMLIKRIITEREGSFSLTDSSLCAQIIFQKYENHLLEAFKQSHHGRELILQGFEDDLVDCAQIDITNLVPLYKDGVIKIPIRPTLPEGNKELQNL